MGIIDWLATPANLSRVEGMADLGNPNAGIDPETLELAVGLSTFPFHNVRMESQGIERNGTGKPGFILGRNEIAKYLVYVRVTVGEEVETGPGPLPGMVIDVAREMGAEPHVVRVHLRRQGEGTAVGYFGHTELERALKEGGDYWRRKLLGGRTARDFLRLAGGRLSKLAVGVRHEPPGPWSKRKFGESAEEKLMREIFGEGSDEDHETPYPGSVTLALSVDTLGRQLEGYAISISHLVQSAKENDEHEILTCTCGHGGCSGIWRGIETVHEDGLVVWRVRGVAPRRVVVFQREQYRQEILAKVRAALALHKELGEKASLGAGDHREFVERALYLAEENQE